MITREFVINRDEEGWTSFTIFNHDLKSNWLLCVLEGVFHTWKYSPSPSGKPKIIIKKKKNLI